MRALILLLLSLVPGLAWAVESRNLGRTADGLVQALKQTICKDLRMNERGCSVSIESATHHHLGPAQSLWALAWKANTAFRLKGETENTMRDALEKKQIQVLDVMPEYFTGIAYFRQQAQQLQQINSAEFTRVALNTTPKAVARIAPKLFRSGDLQYMLPEKWQNEGLSAADRGSINLTIPAAAAELAFALRDLDDAALTGIRIESCRIQAAGEVTDCDPGRLELSGNANNVTLNLIAEKKIKTSQPAFKLVLLERASNATLLHLAIPFRPSPNYLVFAVAGFLFGGLIAVMVLIMRKKPAAPRES